NVSAKGWTLITPWTRPGPLPRPFANGTAGVASSLKLLSLLSIPYPARGICMADSLEFALNGRPIRAANISPNTTLLDFLRSRGLTGAKEGCAEGDCGACSVVITTHDSADKPCYRAINS